mgnify:CR=1 FL=1
MFESKYSKILTIVLVIVIIAIVVLLGFLTFDYITKFSTSKQAADFVETFQGNLTEEENIIEENTTANNVVEEPTLNQNIVLNITQPQINPNPNGGTTTSNKKKYKNFTVAGTMKIPSINFEYPILEEVTTKALDTAVILLYPNSEKLNKPGNVVISGHNYRNGLFFSNLKKLSNGAKIYVTDYSGKSVTYEVYNMFETSSTDTSFYTRDTNGLEELTLSTCTDASNDQRTIVFAKELR